jgi:hypothetical protein
VSCHSQKEVLVASTNNRKYFLPCSSSHSILVFVFYAYCCAFENFFNHTPQLTCCCHRITPNQAMFTSVWANSLPGMSDIVVGGGGEAAFNLPPDNRELPVLLYLFNFVTNLHLCFTGTSTIFARYLSLVSTWFTGIVILEALSCVSLPKQSSLVKEIHILAHKYRLYVTVWNTCKSYSKNEHHHREVE